MLNEHVDVYINGVYNSEISVFNVISEGEIGNLYELDVVIAMPDYPNPEHFKNAIQIHSFLASSYLRAWQDTNIGRNVIKSVLIRALNHAIAFDERGIIFFLDGFDSWAAVDPESFLYETLESWLFRRLYYADPINNGRRFVDSTMFYESGKIVDDPFLGTGYVGEA